MKKDTNFQFTTLLTLFTYLSVHVSFDESIPVYVRVYTMQANLQKRAWIQSFLSQNQGSSISAMSSPSAFCIVRLAEISSAEMVPRRIW